MDVVRERGRMNTGQYSLVENGSVIKGPQQLPKTWGIYSNIRNEVVWPDAKLIADLG